MGLVVLRLQDSAHGYRLGRGNQEAGSPDAVKESAMTDTTVKKVSSAHSPRGDQGEVYLASGTRVHAALAG